MQDINLKIKDVNQVKLQLIIVWAPFLRKYS